MSKTTKTLPDDPEQLKRIILENERRYEKENEMLREQIRLLQAQMFGKKSEKGSGDSGGVQMPLFDMPEPEAEPEEEEVEVPSHQRKKPGRKKLPDALPRVEVIHDIDEDEKVCGCGETLERIGEDISEKLDIIPAVIRVIRHIRPKYACKQCEGLEADGPVVKIDCLSEKFGSVVKGAAGGLIQVSLLTTHSKLRREHESSSQIDLVVPSSIHVSKDSRRLRHRGERGLVD